MKSCDVITVILFACFAVGCGPMFIEPSSPDTPDHPAVRVRDDIWSNIADSINAGELTSSTKLVLVVTHLRSLGKINDADVAAIRGLFPDWDSKEFELGKAEADKILTLPEKAVAK